MAPQQVFRRIASHITNRQYAIQHFFTSRREVPNTGSVARDCLAAERTFLAWARTGLGFVGAGTAVLATWHDNPAALLLMGNGAFLLMFATRRYLRVLEALQNNLFPVDMGSTMLAIAVTATGTIAAAGFVARDEHKRRSKEDDTLAVPQR